ncbi:MAG: class I SAM-dependent methyltransferase [Candidatus Dormibacteraceae bacterium]
MMRRRGSYGLDGSFEHVPAAVQVLGETLFVAALAGVAVHGLARRRRRQAVLAGAPALAIAGIAAFYLQATLLGKFAVWDRLLDDLHLRGDERVLDLGCGRGAVLLAAARRLPRGSAVGVDLWRPDQSGNAEAATRQNAELEGVADRIELHTADMTSLPFPDASFDVVVSNLALHNVVSPAGRRRAIEEAVRVLRPGGRLRLIDLAFTGQHATQLRDAGLVGVDRRSAGWRMWFGGPFLPARLVSATRPRDA